MNPPAISIMSSSSLYLSGEGVVEAKPCARRRARGTPELRETYWMAEVLALVDDLFFQAKMLETARHVGVELRTCARRMRWPAKLRKRRRTLS